jgi:hypothetical protein
MRDPHQQFIPEPAPGRKFIDSFGDNYPSQREMLKEQNPNAQKGDNTLRERMSQREMLKEQKPQTSGLDPQTSLTCHENRCSHMHHKPWLSRKARVLALNPSM